MPFNVNTFRASLVTDGARPSLFEVEMRLPPILAGGLLTQNITLRVRASSLPGDGIAPIVVPYFGREIKVAGTRTFPDWSFTIIQDEDFVARKNLELWLNYINGHVTNLRNPLAASASSYQADGYVRQFGKTGTLLRQYQMVGCFPTDVAPIDLDWATGDSIEEYQVTFAYQWWQDVTGETTDVA